MSPAVSWFLVSFLHLSTSPSFQLCLSVASAPAEPGQRRHIEIFQSISCNTSLLSAEIDIDSKPIQRQLANAMELVGDSSGQVGTILFVLKLLTMGIDDINQARARARLYAARPPHKTQHAHTKAHAIVGRWRCSELAW